MGKTVNDIHLSGTRAAQPAASNSNKGCIYQVTDESNKLEKSDGSSWSTYGPTSLGPSGSAGGDLTGTYPNPTIAADAVTFAKMANLATDRLIGRDTAGTGDPEALTVGGGVEFTGSSGIQRSALTGDVTASAGSNATTIADGAVTEAKQTLADNTTNDVSTAKHGYAPKAPNDATKFLDGTGAWDTVKESDLSTSDITTNNVTSTKHGLAPKSPADATQFLNGAATPAFAAVKDSDLSTSDITTNNASSTKHGFLPKLPNDAAKVLDGTGAYVDISNTKLATITIVIDGAGATITTGVKGDIEIPFACTINRVTLLADQSGSIVVDIWKDTYANYPPTVADTITASAKPTISSATKSQDSTLTGWTTSISAGDTLRFNVDSVTTVQRVTLSLKVTKT